MIAGLALRQSLSRSKAAIGLLATLLLCLFGSPSRADVTHLQIYSATDASAMRALLEAFEASHDDVQMDYVEYNTKELYLDVLAGNAAQADVVISSAMDLQVDLVNRGLARPVTLSRPSTMPDWSSWRSELFGFTYEPVAAVYNRKAFANRPLPRTRSMLASDIRDDPKFYRNKIGTFDIAFSGVGYMFATQDIQRGYQYWRLAESFGRAGLRTYCCTEDLLDGIHDGTLVYGYNAIGSYALERAKKDPEIGVYTFDDYTLVMSRSAFIPKTAPHPELANDFVNFLLSQEAQNILAKNSSLIPLSGAPEQQMDRLAELGKTQALLPIRIGPGLIGYLDHMKQKQVLEDWKATVKVEAP